MGHKHFFTFVRALSVLGAVAQAAEPSAASVLQSEVARQSNESLLWGPYRSNLYFGVRPRIPLSLQTSLMWAKVDNYDVQRTWRYTCEQGEGMHGYGWDEYDTRKGGVQTIHDLDNHIDITTSFVKVPGGAHGGNWAVRVKGEPHEDAPADLKMSAIFFIGSDNMNEVLTPLGSDDDQNANGYVGDVIITGSSEALGEYKFVITEGTGEHPESSHPVSSYKHLDKTVVNSWPMGPENLRWRHDQAVFYQLKKIIDAVMGDNTRLEDAPPPWQLYQLPHQPASGNMQAIQKIFEGAFEFDVLYSSTSAGKDMTSQDLTREIKLTTESFNERFSDIFNRQAPFNKQKYDKFGRSMLSNLVGGIGYFYGDHLVDRSGDPAYYEEDEGFWEETAEARNKHRETLEGPYELFTSIPSRPFFPRGFLWDEGFHLIPVADWDMDLTLDIVKSWYNLMDDDGWIAREQILGNEARTKVPPVFQVQYPHYANPPTLFLIVDTLVQKLQKSNASRTLAKETLSQQAIKLETAHIDNVELGVEYLRTLYPLLQKQYDWFKRTQKGLVRTYDRVAFSSKEAYRWRGRTVQHILTSGLDDYPRPQPPHPGELHVDLLSWVWLMGHNLVNIASALGLQEDVDMYKTAQNAIEHNLVDLHWSEPDGCFCDATIDAYEEHQLVCHKGYVSLFPFLVGMLKQDDPKLGKTLDLLGDEEELFSPYGLRSLSKKNPAYGTEENYWRSPIWVNINYMAITALLDVASGNGPYKAKATDLYSRLRENVVNTVFDSWEETGFAWEQYNPETGKGQRTQHFTGWTSLVVKIMALPDLSSSAAKSAAGHDEL